MSTVDEFIARCDEVIAHPEDFDQRMLADLSKEICASFNHVIPHISRYRGMHINGEVPPYTAQDIRKLRGKLAVYRDEKEHELEVARLNADAVNTNLSVNNSNSNVATATANAAVTISQAFDALESCSLSPEELSEMKVAIADLEAAKGKGPETICEKASKLLDLAKKGADTAKAVAPYVAGALATLGAIL